MELIQPGSRSQQGQLSKYFFPIASSLFKVHFKDMRGTQMSKKPVFLELKVQLTCSPRQSFYDQ